MNTIQTLKSYPKVEKRRLWRAAVSLYKKQEPKAFFKTYIPGLVAGILGAHLGIAVQSQIEHWVGYIYLVGIAGLFGFIGGCISSKRLHKNIDPYLKQVIKTKESKE